jgi:hypothetical protein
VNGVRREIENARPATPEAPKQLPWAHDHDLPRTDAEKVQIYNLNQTIMNLARHLCYELASYRGDHTRVVHMQEDQSPEALDARKQTAERAQSFRDLLTECGFPVDKLRGSYQLEEGDRQILDALETVLENVAEGRTSGHQQFSAPDEELENTAKQMLGIHLSVYLRETGIYS